MHAKIDLRGEIRVLRHESTMLRDNPLGDPSTRDVYVYLPHSYDQGSVKYPIVFCLTGFTGRGKALLNDNAFAPNLAERMDRLIANGVIRPMIAVMPDCYTSVGGSQYINSTATGRYEDYLVDELVPFVDETFRTTADRASRAVMGKSSGGYGSLIMGLRHSEIFGLVCSTSGDAYFDLCYVTDFAQAFRAINGDAAAFVKRFWSMEKKNKRDFPGLNIIGMSACYSPNGVSFDLPFDLETGEINGTVWERWLEHDPVRLVERYSDNLRSLKLLFIDAGRRDEFALDIGARVLSKRLTALGIDHIHEEFDDGHFSIAYRHDRSLQMISDHLGS